MTAVEILASPLALDPFDAVSSPESAGLRLRLRDATEHTVGFVDGGWWPRTLDLTVELPPLLAQLFSAGFDIFRVTYDLTYWDPAPRRLAVNGRRVKLGGYRTQDPAVISLVDSSGWKRIDLVVVPPQTDELIAQHALALAGLDGDLQRAAAILTAAAE